MLSLILTVRSIVVDRLRSTKTVISRSSPITTNDGIMDYIVN